LNRLAFAPPPDDNQAEAHTSPLVKRRKRPLNATGAE
jgi:hypothetical protein